MGKIKVLMVDDEIQFRETTSKILTRRGYLTTVAGTGEEALNILKKDLHDVVVLDIKMPGMDGHEALAEIKKISPDIQVIMLTGHGHGESAKKSLKHDAFDYLTKPCDIDRLSARINEAYSLGHKEKAEEKKAIDIMISLDDYTIIGPNQSIRDGIEALKKSYEGLVSTSRIMWTGHRSILVMENKDLVGILSIMDLVQALRPAYLSAPKPSMAYGMEYSSMFWTGLFTTQAKALAKKRITDVMSPPPLSVDAQTNLMEVANLLYEEDARRLVVRKEGHLVGVLREQEIFYELSRIMLAE